MLKKSEKKNCVELSTVTVAVRLNELGVMPVTATVLPVVKP